MTENKKPVIHRKVLSAELEREQRRKRVASLFARGMSPREIAGVLNIVPATVTKDLNIIRSNISRQVTSMSREELAVAALCTIVYLARCYPHPTSGPNAVSVSGGKDTLA